MHVRNIFIFFLLTMNKKGNEADTKKEANLLLITFVVVNF